MARIDLGSIIGTIVKLAPSGLLPGIVGKLLPKVVEKVAGDLPNFVVDGKPTWREILHSEKIQDAVAAGLGALVRKYLPDTDEKAVGRILKKLGDNIDG